MINFEQLLRDNFTVANEIYLQRYLKLCLGVYNLNQFETDYIESHHILPKWLFKEYEFNKDNLVDLPVRIHMIAHFCLMKACPHYKNTLSYCLTTGQNVKVHKVKYKPSKLFEIARQQLSIQKKGCKGPTISEEAKARMRESMIERYSNPEERLKQSQRCKGISKSDTSKIAEAAQNRFKDPEQRRLAAEKTKAFFANMSDEERKEYHRVSRENVDPKEYGKFSNCRTIFISPIGHFKSKHPKELAGSGSENSILNNCINNDKPISQMSKHNLLYKLLIKTRFKDMTPKQLGFYTIPFEEYVESRELLNQVRPLSPNHDLLLILGDSLSQRNVHLEIPTHSNQ